MDKSRLKKRFHDKITDTFCEACQLKPKFSFKWCRWCQNKPLFWKSADKLANMVLEMLDKEKKGISPDK